MRFHNFRDLVYPVSSVLILLMFCINTAEARSKYNKPKPINDKKLESIMAELPKQLEYVKYSIDRTKVTNRYAYINESTLELMRLSNKKWYKGKHWQAAQEKAIQFLADMVGQYGAMVGYGNDLTKALLAYPGPQPLQLSAMLKAYNDNTLWETEALRQKLIKVNPDTEFLPEEKITPVTRDALLLRKLSLYKSIIKTARHDDKHVLPIVYQRMELRNPLREFPFKALAKLEDNSPTTLKRIDRLIEENENLELRMKAAYVRWRITRDVDYLAEFTIGNLVGNLENIAYEKYSAINSILINLFWSGESAEQMGRILFELETEHEALCGPRLSRKDPAKNKMERYIAGLEYIRYLQCKERVALVQWIIDPYIRPVLEKHFNKVGFYSRESLDGIYINSFMAEPLVPALELTYKRGDSFKIAPEGRKATFSVNGLKDRAAIALQAITGEHYKGAPELSEDWQKKYAKNRTSSWFWLPY